MAFEIAQGIFLLELSPPSSNAYLVGKNILVDPGLSSEKELAQELLEAGSALGNISSVLLTHSHADHSFNLHFLSKAIVYAHPLTLSRFSKGEREPTAFEMFGVEMPVLKKTKQLADGAELTLDGFCFAASFTPGHNQDAISFLEKGTQTVFAGDCLFSGGGLPRIFDGCNESLLLSSWKKLEKEFAGAQLLAPGHGAPASFEKELARSIRALE